MDNSGFYLTGDTTWPGLGTVAAVLSSKIVTNMIMRDHPIKNVQKHLHQTIHSELWSNLEAIHPYGV